MLVKSYCNGERWQADYFALPDLFLQQVIHSVKETAKVGMITNPV